MTDLVGSGYFLEYGLLLVVDFQGSVLAASIPSSLLTLIGLVHLLRLLVSILDLERFAEYDHHPFSLTSVRQNSHGLPEHLARRSV